MMIIQGSRSTRYNNRLIVIEWKLALVLFYFEFKSAKAW